MIYSHHMRNVGERQCQIRYEYSINFNGFKQKKIKNKIFCSIRLKSEFFHI